MLYRLRSLFSRDAGSEDVRQSLLRRFPNHLDLIDSREIPHEYSTGPDLSYYTESAQYYYDLIVESSPFMDDPQMSSVANNRIVNAGWGLIAKGAEAVPFAIQLVRSKNRDHREAAADVFCGLRDPQRLPDILEHVHATLEHETDQLVLDSLLGALGALRSRDSIPMLARYINDDSVDPDTRDNAACSLGLIVRKRFDKSERGTVRAACEWLASNGYEP